MPGAWTASAPCWIGKPRERPESRGRAPQLSSMTSWSRTASPSHPTRRNCMSLTPASPTGRTTHRIFNLEGARLSWFAHGGTLTSASALTDVGISAGSQEGDPFMRKIYLTMAIGGALLGVGAFANAQGTSTGGASGHDMKQCWDVSNKVVRDVSGATATGPSGNTTVGSTTSPGPSSGTSPAPSSGTSANANASSRPPGMPDC